MPLSGRIPLAWQPSCRTDIFPDSGTLFPDFRASISRFPQGGFRKSTNGEIRSSTRGKPGRAPASSSAPGAFAIQGWMILGFPAFAAILLAASPRPWTYWWSGTSAQ